MRRIKASTILANIGAWIASLMILVPMIVALLMRNDSTPSAAPITNMNEKNASTHNRLLRIVMFAKNLRITRTIP